MGYFSLFNQTFAQDSGIYIDLQRFRNGYTLFQINLEDYNHGENFTESRLGTARLTLHFAPNTNATIKCLLYAQFNNILQITQSREVIKNF